MLPLVRAAALVLLLAAPAVSAATLYVDDVSCSGQPSPCTTDLQGALDDTSYDTVRLLAGSRFTGDFLIGRILELVGETGAALIASDEYALRVERTSRVVISGIEIEGRLAVYDSDIVDLVGLVVGGDSIGVQIKDSTYVTVAACEIDATSRGIDARDSAATLVTDSDVVSDGHGVVASSSDTTVLRGSLDADDEALVVQDGGSSTSESFDVTDATLSSVSADEVWRHDDHTTSFSGCTPATPDETVSSSSQLLSLVGYEPWNGD